MTRHPTIYSKPKTNRTHTTFKELLFQIAPAGGGPGPLAGSTAGAGFGSAYPVKLCRLQYHEPSS